MKVTAFVTDTISIRAACLLQRSPEFFRKAGPLPGVNLALVGWQLYPGRSFHVGTVGR